MPLPKDPAERFVHLLRWANGNTQAAEMLDIVGRIARLADDLADGDQAPSVLKVGELLHMSMVDLPSNPFFKQHFQALIPSISDGILSWEVSEEWRAGEGKRPVFGFVYREAVERIAHTVALLTGGTNHARRVIRELHAVCHDGVRETVDEWVSEKGQV
jgi:hypothetical protein